ncbi:MAG: FtsX-like permease family protein [Bacteroidota bacterium]
MNFPFYIARRYFVSRKSHNIINIISGISVAGVTIGTMALIIVLSVFNGFQELVISLFNSFNPDLQITASVGKTFHEESFPVEDVKKIKGVISMTKFIEENALAKYRDKQYIVTIKGVDENFASFSGLDSMVTEGKFKLQDGDQNFAVLGSGVAFYLNANLTDYLSPISLYVPKRDAAFTGVLENAFNNEVIFPSGFCSVQEEFDSKYILAPLRFVRKLMDYKDEVTGIDLWLKKGENAERVGEKIKILAGPGFTIKDRFQQQETLYKVMKSEKWAIFMILSFILFIATFNVLGSLSMLILDKKQDISVLQCLGASQSLIRKIFLTEGMMISLIGAITGLALGGAICKLQQVFGFVKLGSPGNTFVVDAYLVSMHPVDFILVFFTVIFIGFLAAWYPVYNIRKIDTHILNQRG